MSDASSSGGRGPGPGGGCSAAATRKERDKKICTRRRTGPGHPCVHPVPPKVAVQDKRMERRAAGGSLRGNSEQHIADRQAGPDGSRVSASAANPRRLAKEGSASIAPDDEEAVSRPGAVARGTSRQRRRRLPTTGGQRGACQRQRGPLRGLFRWWCW